VFSVVKIGELNRLGGAVYAVGFGRRDVDDLRRRDRLWETQLTRDAFTYRTGVDYGVDDVQRQKHD